jgi:hypothetical protein
MRSLTAVCFFFSGMIQTSGRTRSLGPSICHAHNQKVVNLTTRVGSLIGTVRNFLATHSYGCRSTAVREKAAAACLSSTPQIVWHELPCCRGGGGLLLLLPAPPRRGRRPDSAYAHIPTHLPHEDDAASRGLPHVRRVAHWQRGRQRRRIIPVNSFIGDSITVLLFTEAA